MQRSASKPTDERPHMPRPILPARLILTAVLACLTLAACGADGEPQAPSAGVTVSGEAKIGVVVK